MVEKGIRGGVCHAILRYAKANNKYMKDYNKDEEEPFSQYNDANNLYGFAMSEPLPVDGFEWMKDLSKIEKDFIKNYDENSYKGYILEVKVEYPKNLHDLHSDLPFLPERMKIEKDLSKIDKDFIKNYDENSDKGNILEVKVEYPKNLHDLHSDLPFLTERMKIDKCKKVACNLFDKKRYVVHIRSLKQTLNHWLTLNKVHRVIQFNQEAWLKTYIDMNTELRKQAKNYFEKDFSKLMNNSVFGKTMENVRKHRDIKLVTTDKRRNQLVSEPNYHTKKWCLENLLAIEMKKAKVKMNKPVYLGLSILEISKTLMYEFWYDYIKPKYSDNVKLCYMDTDSFIMRIKTKDFYKDIADDVEKIFDTSNYECDRLLPTGKNKKVIGLMKDEIGGKIMTEFVALRPKTYSCLTDDCKEDKKAKGTKKCVIKRRLKFNDYKDCLLNNKIVLK